MEKTCLANTLQSFLFSKKKTYKSKTNLPCIGIIPAFSIFGKICNLYFQTALCKALNLHKFFLYWELCS